MSHQDPPDRASGPTRRLFLRGAASLTAALGALRLRPGPAEAAPAIAEDGVPASTPGEPARPAAAPRAVVATGGPPPSTRRAILPMSSGREILPGQSVTISSRPQNGPFRPERMIIGGSPSDWVVEDIRIGSHATIGGGRSQLRRGTSSVPGAAFSSAEFRCGGATVTANTVTANLKADGFDVCRAGMDMAVRVTFVGSDPAGSPFVCGILGDSIT